MLQLHGLSTDSPNTPMGSVVDVANVTTVPLLVQNMQKITSISHVETVMRRMRIHEASMVWSAIWLCETLRVQQPPANVLHIPTWRQCNLDKVNGWPDRKHM